MPTLVMLASSSSSSSPVLPASLRTADAAQGGGRRRGRGAHVRNHALPLAPSSSLPPIFWDLMMRGPVAKLQVMASCSPGAGACLAASGLVARTTSSSPPRWLPSSREGRGQGSSPSPPLPITALHSTLSSVKAGGMMSFAIDSLGALWMWGNCSQQTDAGEFCIANSYVPLPVWDFHGHSVVKVACGNEHVVAAVSAGETYTGGDLVCYAWGNNNHGQLGLGDKESRCRPVLISAFREESSWEIYEIACRAWHTAVLTNKKTFDQDLESRCWTFGLGDNGQLGHGTTATICSTCWLTNRILPYLS